MNYRTLLKKIFPHSLIVAARRAVKSAAYMCLNLRYIWKVRKLRAKNVVNVVFFVLFDSTWKLDYLYRKLSASSSFNPTIVVCPIVNFGRENMLQNLELTYRYFKSKGFNVVKSFEESTDTWLDVRKVLAPDVIFFSSPYRGQVDNRFYISEYRDVLTCYVPYFYNECRDIGFINHPVHNYSWKFFVETPFHEDFCRRNMHNSGLNVVMTGYPGVDYFLDKDYQAKDVWKVRNPSLKRIIWAPHHTILPTDVIYYSCFLILADFMLRMAKKYSGSIQIAFKPHPVLRNKLNEYWGKERTDEYYKEWDSGENTFFENGEYVDLFLTSDAMIHDSGSFLIEYLYLDKPVMRTDNGQSLQNEFNDFAFSCLDHYYQGKTEDEVEKFIKMVIDGEDEKKESRRKFLTENLLPYNRRLPSDNIYDFLVNEFRK